MRRTIVSLSLFLSGCLALAGTPSRPPLGSVLDSLESVRNFRETAISPDGRRVAWVERIRDREGTELLSAIYLSDFSAGPASQISAARDGRSCRERDVAWSPDGRSLAFLSDAAHPPQLDLYVVPDARGPVRRLTHTTGQLQHLRWSPDGKTIAFLFTAGSAQEPGALVAYKPDSGLVGEVIEEQRIATVDLATGNIREISPENLYVYDYDWSSDGKRFAAEAAEGSGTNNYWIAKLYTVDAETGTTRSLWNPPLQIACPRFSPDGKSIAVIHGIMSDEGSTGGDIWVVPAAGGQAKTLTPGMKASASALFWRPTGEILFRGYADGQDGLARLDPTTGRIDFLWTGAETLHGVSLARAGNKSAVIRDSFTSPPEVWAGPIGAWLPLTRANAKAARSWGEARTLHWTSDGMTIQGWLLYPKDFDPSRPYPMVVSVHGGPSSCYTPGWPSRWNAVLPSQGFLVFLPNPRGSYGFGEAFTLGNVKDFGGGDLRDILAGVDEVLKTAPVDGNRLGIAGWSYGGYMVMWAVTQTGRFAAAVAGAGIASWQSYYGQNRIDRWMVPFFGASVYEDPKVYARSSPIEFIQRAKTPTLVLHGDRDSEVPTPQGYEFWHALKTLGVPTDLVIYENEGHAIRERGHVRDIEERLVAWFEKYLKG